MHRRTRTLLRFGLLFFAVFFSVVAFAQYGFVRWQLHRTVSAELQESAEELQREIAYDGHWDLAGFRRELTKAPSNYVVIKKDGLLIDVEGLVSGLLPRASLPREVPLGRPMPFESSVGEHWNLFVRAVQGGVAIVGEPVSANDSDVAKRLPVNAGRFGTTIDQASRVSERNIDGVIDYAVVDEAGGIRQAAGGIPLIVNASTLAETLAKGPRLALNGRPYYLFSLPIAAGGAEPVGTIVVFKDISLEERMVHRTILFSLAVGGVSWLITGLVFGAYAYSQRGIRISCEEAYSREEGQTIEFKSSLRWDAENQKANKELERAVIKTVAAFLNTEGGVLLIGVDDKKQVLGLEGDYKTLREKPNKDGFELTLQQVLSNAIGADSYVRDVRVGFCNMDGKEICVVSVDRSRKPVIVEEVTSSGRQPTLYVRIGNSTKALNLKEALDYSKDRWGI